MSCIRILFGILLVILTTTGTQSLGHPAVVSMKDSSGCQAIGKSPDKDNYYQEAAMLEVQENTSSVSKEKRDNQDFNTLTGLFSRYLSFVFRADGDPGVSVAAPRLVLVRSLPRYILYRSLIIPF
ncbi:MAG: hypothetical protein J7619_29910 [Dyadobacter sp.]|uniref:hypothetical protein n=1 Tax=Dyadobacter sp. TaxID=1914288 RepID=UPI001B085336|nr:hypothetical protein [Dyadobacter sp.]MBO9616939.1 hypothetical protein [Dyadobacter sp.]